MKYLIFFLVLMSFFSCQEKTKGNTTASFVTKIQYQIKESVCDTTVKYDINLLMPTFSEFFGVRILSEKERTVFKYENEPYKYVYKYDSINNKRTVLEDRKQDLVLNDFSSVFYDVICEMIQKANIQKEKEFKPMSSESIVLNIKAIDKQKKETLYKKRFFIDDNKFKYSKRLLSLNKFMIYYADSLRLNFKTKSILKIKESLK
ncbi:hypothetical protein [Tenacibaculum litopenaei]|uniref:hypothetical protein n=1 Tax=Tenacibaculum litopenaei TaxID=396016 RepID=UPI0038B43455